MTDPLDTLGRRAGAQLRRRAESLESTGEGLASVRRRAARPPVTVATGVAGLLLLAVVAVAWLVRVDGAGPIDAERDGQTVLDAGADSGWEAVGDEAFRSMEGLVSVTGVAVADGTVVAVGGDARNGPDGRVGPGVWRSTDGREWEPVAGDRIDVGGDRFTGAAVRMTDVTVVEHEDRARLVAVGWAQPETGRVPLVWVSDDLGGSWRVIEPEPVGGQLHAVTASPGGIVAVGSVEGEGGATWVSSDGQRWERQTPAGLADTDLLHSVAGAGGQFAAAAIVPELEPTLRVSRDGRSWQPAQLASISDGRVGISRVVAAEDGGFLAVGAVVPPGEAEPEGVVLRSTDGRTWQPAAEPLGRIRGDGAQRVHDITAGAEGLIAVGESDGDPVVWHARHGRRWEVAARGDHLLAGAGADATAAMTRVHRLPGGLLAIGSVTDTSDRPERPVLWLHPAARDEPTGRTPPPEPTGVRLVASSDTRLTVADVDAATTESLDLDALSGGDPPFRLARRGDALAFYGAGGDTYAVEPDDPQHARKIGDSTYFLPSSHEDRLWLVDGAAGTAAGNRVREVTVDGRETVEPVDTPSGTVPAGAVAGGIVLSTGAGLEVWDPQAEDAVARLPDAQFVAAGETLLAWCRERCASLHIAALGEESPLPPEVDERALDVPDGRWGGHGAFAPGGARLAATIRFDDGPFAEPGVEFKLAVVDIADGEVTVLHDAGVEPGPFAWSPDGRWVFAPAAGDGVLIHDVERDRTDARALDLGTVHGLAVVE